jgi:hypothetical protein
MQCPVQIKKVHIKFLKIPYIKKGRARPPHEHVKHIQYIYNYCMPPVWRYKHTATVQESVKCTFIMGAWIEKYRINP